MFDKRERWMAKTYDAVLKHLVEAYPAAWLQSLGFPTTAPVRVIDADVSAVTAAADKVFWVEETPPWWSAFGSCPWSRCWSAAWGCFRWR
jgi:hypothetical protein